MEIHTDDPDVVFNRAKVAMLVKDDEYFNVYGPRQSMKTAYLMQLQTVLNNTRDWEGKRMFSCILVSAQGIMSRCKGDPNIADKILAAKINDLCPPDTRPVDNYDDIMGNPNAFTKVLREWSLNEAKKGRKAELLIDEFDCLKGDVLNSIGADIRTMYPDRDANEAPKTIVLCGMRPVRDIKNPDGSLVFGNIDESPFNILHELGLNGRTRGLPKEKIQELFAQWETQDNVKVSEEAISRVHEWTSGQPWLVNRIGRGLQLKYGNPSLGDAKKVDANDVDEIATSLINQWEHSKKGLDTHFHSLFHRLEKNEGVRKAVADALGLPGRETDNGSGLGNAVALGLLKDAKRAANLLYQKMLPKALFRARAKIYTKCSPENWGTCFIDPKTGLMKWEDVMRFISDTYIPKILKYKHFEEYDVRNVVWTVVQGTWNSSRTTAIEESVPDGGRQDLVLKDADGKIVEVVEVKLRGASDGEWKKAG